MRVDSYIYQMEQRRNEEKTELKKNTEDSDVIVALNTKLNARVAEGVSAGVDALKTSNFDVESLINRLKTKVASIDENAYNKLIKKGLDDYTDAYNNAKSIISMCNKNITIIDFSNGIESAAQVVLQHPLTTAMEKFNIDGAIKRVNTIKQSNIELNEQINQMKKDCNKLYDEIDNLIKKLIIMRDEMEDVRKSLKDVVILNSKGEDIAKKRRKRARNRRNEIDDIVSILRAFLFKLRELGS